MLCNFACNSPDCISDLVIESLIFCGFWACIDSCAGGIACEICESEVLLTSVGLRVGGIVAGRLLCIVQARQNSPSAAGLSRAREKNRPACAKHPKLGAFVSAGRILSRTRSNMPRAGRRKSRLRAPQPGSQTVRRPPRQSREGASECLALSNFARNSPAATSNHEVASLQLQRLWTVSKIDRGKLRAIFVWLWLWLWLWPCRGPRPVCIGNLSRETAITFARSYVPGVETAIAFAGEKRVFLVCFSVAVVTVVSTVAVQGRAVVMVVSCWPASVAAEASLVSTSPCRSILCAKKFALFGPGRLRPQGPNEAPAHASCVGGRQGKDCLELKRCTQRVEGT